MIGDGYHHGAVSWFMGTLCFELGYLSAQPSMEQIVRQDVCQLHVVRRNSCEEPRPRSSTVHLAESLTRWFLARTDARGSDVRLCTGELLQPRRISRQSVDPGLWRWRTSMAYCWKRPGSHINELESQAILMELVAVIVAGDLDGKRGSVHLEGVLPNPQHETPTTIQPSQARPPQPQRTSTAQW